MISKNLEKNNLMVFLTFGLVCLAALILKLVNWKNYSQVVSVKYKEDYLCTVAILSAILFHSIMDLFYQKLRQLIKIHDQRKIFKEVWIAIKRSFQFLVFFLQFVLATTIIVRVVLLRNPEWDHEIVVFGSLVKMSEIAIAIVWTLICILSTISIIHLGWVIYNDEPRQTPRTCRSILLMLLWTVPMLIGTFLYFITVNWYVYTACTSTLDTKFQFCQIFPATSLLIQGLVQILFMRRRGYNIHTFVGFSNVSFNLVMMIHLCTCFVDGIGTNIHSPDLHVLLPTALVVTSPFELAHRVVALMPNILALNVLQPMFAPRRHSPPKLSPAVLEKQIMEQNINIVLNRELVLHNARLQQPDLILSKIATLGWSIDDCLILRTQPCPSCDVVDNMVLKRTKIEQENPQVIAPSIYEMFPKQAHHDPIWDGVSYVGGAPIVPNDRCDGITPGGTVQGCYSECAVDVSGQGRESGIQDAFCVGSFG